MERTSHDLMIMLYSVCRPMYERTGTEPARFICEISRCDFEDIVSLLFAGGDASIEELVGRLRTISPAQCAPPPESSLILSTRRMARRLGVTQKWLTQMAMDGKVPALRAGAGRLLFSPDVTETALARLVAGISSTGGPSVPTREGV